MVAASILICHYYCFGCFFSGAQHAKNSCHQKDRAMNTMEWSFHPIVCLMTSAGGAYLHACIDISPISISLGSYMDNASGRCTCGKACPVLVPVMSRRRSGDVPFSSHWCLDVFFSVLQCPGQSRWVELFSNSDKLGVLHVRQPGAHVSVCSDRQPCLCQVPVCLAQISHARSCSSHVLVMLWLLESVRYSLLITDLAHFVLMKT